jgi:hypothetical protein
MDGGWTHDGRGDGRGGGPTRKSKQAPRGESGQDISDNEGASEQDECYYVDHPGSASPSSTVFRVNFEYNPAYPHEGGANYSQRSLPTVKWFE